MARYQIYSASSLECLHSQLFRSLFEKAKEHFKQSTLAHSACFSYLLVRSYLCLSCLNCRLMDLDGEKSAERADEESSRLSWFGIGGFGDVVLVLIAEIEFDSCLPRFVLEARMLLSFRHGHFLVIELEI